MVNRNLKLRVPPVDKKPAYYLWDVVGLRAALETGRLALVEFLVEEGNCLIRIEIVSSAGGIYYMNDTSECRKLIAKTIGRS